MVEYVELKKLPQSREHRRKALQEQTKVIKVAGNMLNYFGHAVLKDTDVLSESQIITEHNKAWNKFAQKYSRKLEWLNVKPDFIKKIYEQSQKAEQKLQKRTAKAE